MDTTVKTCTRCLKPWERNPVSGELTCFRHGRPDGSAFEKSIWENTRTTGEGEVYMSNTDQDLIRDRVAYDLLGVAHKISPTGTEQQAFVELAEAARKDGCSEKQVVQQLLSAMLDGMRYGNWPKKETP